MGTRLKINYQIQLIPEQDYGKEGLFFVSNFLDVPLRAFNSIAFSEEVSEDIRSILKSIKKEEEKQHGI